MNLYLIRHGQSYINLPEWIGKNSDEALTELGQRQAAALGGVVAEAFSCTGCTLCQHHAPGA
ncbi:MAG: histidine phosphatase family protein [Caldilineaceae bacterium]